MIDNDIKKIKKSTDENKENYTERANNIASALGRFNEDLIPAI